MDNVDNYNVNRKVSTFGDFCDKIGAEQEELKDVKSSYSKNSERQQFPKNSKFKFNKVTRKMDDLSPEEVDDDIDAIEEVTEHLVDDGESKSKIRLERVGSIINPGSRSTGSKYAFVEVIDGEEVRNGKYISLTVEQREVIEKALNR